MSEEVDALKSELAEVSNKLNEALKQVEGLEKLRGKHGDELGGVRKKLEKLEELETLVEDMKGSRDALLEEMKSLKEKGSGAVKGPQSAPTESEREKADRLESELTDDEKDKIKKVVSVWQEDEELKANVERFKSDDAFRVALFEQIKQRQSADDELFRVKPKKVASSEDTKSLVEKLMKQDRVRDIVADERSTFGTSSPRQEKVSVPPQWY